MVTEMIEESFNEPFKTGPLIDQQGNYPIFDILMNRCSRPAGSALQSGPRTTPLKFRTQPISMPIVAIVGGIDRCDMDVLLWC
jgi:hypothetical protein